MNDLLSKLHLDSTMLGLGAIGLVGISVIALSAWALLGSRKTKRKINHTFSISTDSYFILKPKEFLSVSHSELG